MMERGTWLSELDPITSSTDDTLELQAGSAKLLRMPHSREVRALSQERRRSINSRSKARNSFILVRTRDMSVDQRVHLAAAQLWPIP